MRFWLIVAAVNVVLHVVAVMMVRRPLAADMALTPSDLAQFPDEQAALITAMHGQAGLRGFRWFGVITVQTWVDKPAHPAALWWNGDIGAWLTFESLGRKWNIELCADFEDGSKLSVSKVPIAHLAPPPDAVLISTPAMRSFEDLWRALPTPLDQLPTRRGWPGPGQEWQRVHERRELMLGHWMATNRAAPSADGRGIRVSFIAANIFVILGGFGVRHIVQAVTNRRSRSTVSALGLRVADPVRPPGLHHV